jgi:hypothetical protein
MKRTFFAIIFGIGSIIAVGQARLGSSVSEIRSEWSESKYKLKSGYDTDGDYYITIETERATVTYYFNAEKVCYLTAIVPDNQGALNFYVELYNKQYVIISATQWKMYSKNGISNVELIFSEGGGYYFLWSN